MNLKEKAKLLGIMGLSLIVLSSCKNNESTEPTPVIVAKSDTVETTSNDSSDLDIFNVLDNDALDGQPVSIENISLNIVTPDPKGTISLNSDGTIDLLQNAGRGVFSLEYEICEKGKENCSSVTVTVLIDMVAGVFMKGAVEGLAYNTETTEGYTTSEGEFYYKPGDTIRFYIGNTQLGEPVEAISSLDIYDLVPGVQLPTERKEVELFLEQYGEEFGVHARLDKQYELINILRFIYSVDSDKQSSNGVFINPGVHDAYLQTSYDLKKKSDKFRTLSGFDRLLREAHKNGDITSGRVINTWKALDDYYQLQDLVASIYIRTESRTDEGADGSFEFISSLTFNEAGLTFSSKRSDGTETVYSFNEFGDFLSQLDSKTGESQTVQYNIHGDSMVVTRDNDGDGRNDIILTFETDPNGNIASISDDEDANGQIDNITYYEYDQEKRKTLIANDGDADGQVDSIMTFEYDANGNLLRNTTDTVGDSKAASVSTYEYDVNDNLVLESYDGDGDGIPEQVITHEYDTNGNKTLESYDNDGDGLPNVVYTYEYDANGNLTLEHLNGETRDRILVYEYDANGNRVLESDDTDGDGQADRVTTFAYDMNNNLIMISFDTEGDGKINSVTAYEYDANGNLILESRDHGVGFIPYMRYAYDDNGNRTLWSKDLDGDGVMDTSETYEYDANQNLVRSIRDFKADGAPDRIYEYKYQIISFLGWNTCWGCN